MLRYLVDRAKLAPLAFFAAAGIQACASSATDATGLTPAPAFTLTFGASALSVNQGSAVSTSVRAARSGGLVSAITYTVSGTPTGLTVSVPSPTVADSATLTIAASATLAVGTYPIVVSATAPGAIAQQATIAVTVSIPVSGSPKLNFVVAGAHTCALTTTGAAYCWGYNANGQLGNNDTSIVNPTPVATVGGLAFTVLSVSKVEETTCGLSTSGAAYCWGENGEGQLGDGTKARHLTPTPVAGGLTFKSIAVGNSHVCAVATSGTAYCWGSTPNGAFGDGSVGEHLTPTATATGMTFQSIVTGSDYTCGLTTGGAAYCWGLGPGGQLGDGNATTSTTPVAVSGGLTFRSLAAGGLSVCGLTTAGRAYCWGNNFFGTVGDGSGDMTGGTTRRVTPVAVTGGLTFESLSAGYQTMCAVTDAGVGYCWGYNFGAVGDATPDHRSSPTAVSGGLAFQSISAGTGYSCGVTTASAVYCWGDNSDGALGDGTITPRFTPGPVHWP